MRKLWILLCALPAFGQSYYGTATSPRGLPLPGQTVAVCTQPANTSTTPCSPLATTYTSVALTTPTSTPGLTTTDALGNFHVYTATGLVTIQIYGPQVGTPLVQTDVTVPINAAGNNSFSGSTAFGSWIILGSSSAGATADAKITNAANSCTGGAACYIDACGLNGAQSFSADPLPNGHQYTLHLCNATYSYDPTAMAFTLPSNTRLILDNATIISSRSDGMGSSTPNILVGMVSSRAYQVTGSITSGQNTLTVSSATNATVGAVVAVVGAWGGMNGSNGWGTQSTTINTGGGMGAGDTSVIVTSTSGFNAGSDIVGPFLLIDSEIIGYTGTTGTTFTGLTRGRFGTTAATHANTTNIYQLGSMVSQITGIAGSVLTLQDNATFTVANANVVIGSTHVSIEGSGTIDGNYTNRANPQSSPVYAIALPFASMSYVGPNITMQNVPVHTLFNFQGWRNEIHGIYRYGGRPSVGLGSDLTFIGGKYNRVSTTSHENGNFMVLLDDRSIASSIFDGPSSGNIVDVGPQVGGVQYSEAIGIEGGNNNNYVRAGNLSCNTVQINGCVYITSSGQWTSDPSISGNRIDVASVNETGGGGSLSILLNASGNIIYSGKATGNGLIQDASNNQIIYIDSNNALNFASGLVNALAFRRSQGNVAFPDLSGDGTHQLVAGDANGLSLATNANLRIPGGMIVGATDGSFFKAYGATFQRSTGNTGFPDIFGDGTNALVLGGKSDGSGTVKFGTTTIVEIASGGKLQGTGGGFVPIQAAFFTRSGGAAGFPDIFGDGTNALVLAGKSDGSGAVRFGSATRLKLTDMGQCTMAAGTCAAQSLASTYASAPLCFANWTGTGTLTGLLKVPSTTTTTTPASSVGTDTAQVNWACYGN